MMKAALWVSAWMLAMLVATASEPKPPEVTVVKPLLTGTALTTQKEFLHELTVLPNKARPQLLAYYPPNGNIVLRYYLFRPKGFDRSKKYPLVLSLHHQGVEKNFADLLIENPPGNGYGIGRFICDQTQDKYPSFLIVPWCNARHWEAGSWSEITPQNKYPTPNMRAVIGLMDNFRKNTNVDERRIYVTGQSMGAFGTWDIIARRPDIFAAAIPIGGGGDPLGVFKIREMPIWAFHGIDDSEIPVERSRAMIRNLIKTGGHPIYWEFEKAGQRDAGERAYSERGLTDWLFQQTKP